MVVTRMPTEFRIQLLFNFKCIFNFGSRAAMTQRILGPALLCSRPLVIATSCCSWLHRLELLRQAQEKDGNSGR